MKLLLESSSINAEILFDIAYLDGTILENELKKFKDVEKWFEKLKSDIAEFCPSIEEVNICLHKDSHFNEHLQKLGFTFYRHGYCPSLEYLIFSL